MTLRDLRRPSDGLEVLRSHADGANDADCRIAEAFCLLDLERLDEAEGAARAAVGIAPTDGRAWIVLAYVRRDQKQLIEAVAAGGQAVSLLPGAPGAHGAYAEILAELGRFPEAMWHAETRRSLAPDHPGGWITLAHVQLRQSKWVDAELSARSALAIDPANAQALTILSLAQSQRGMRATAAANAMQVVRDNPADVDPRPLFKTIAFGGGLPTYVKVAVIGSFVFGLGGIGIIAWVGHSLKRWFELPPEVRSILWADRGIKLRLIACLVTAIGLAAIMTYGLVVVVSNGGNPQ